MISPLHSGREQRRINAAGENLKSSADHVLVVAVEGARPIRQAGRSFHLQGRERVSVKHHEQKENSNLIVADRLGNCRYVQG